MWVWGCKTDTDEELRRAAERYAVRFRQPTDRCILPMEIQRTHLGVSLWYPLPCSAPATKTIPAPEVVVPAHQLNLLEV